MKKILLTAILLIPTMFILMPTGYAFNPPIDPAVENLMGPAIVGTFTAYPRTDGGTIYSFEGNCKGQPVAYAGETNFQYEDITRTGVNGLENLRLGVPEWWLTTYPGCFPNSSPEYFIVNTVINFNKTDTLLTADAVIMFTIPKGSK